MNPSSKHIVLDNVCNKYKLIIIAMNLLEKIEFIYYCNYGGIKSFTNNCFIEQLTIMFSQTEQTIE